MKDKPGRRDLERFAETTGKKMYAAFAADLKRKQKMLLNSEPEVAMVTLVNTALVPLIMLSRSDMFRNLSADDFADMLRTQFVKLNAVTTNVRPTKH